MNILFYTAVNYCTDAQCFRDFVVGNDYTTYDADNWITHASNWVTFDGSPSLGFDNSGIQKDFGAGGILSGLDISLEFSMKLVFNESNESSYTAIYFSDGPIIGTDIEPEGFTSPARHGFGFRPTTSDGIDVRAYSGNGSGNNNTSGIYSHFEGSPSYPITIYVICSYSYQSGVGGTIEATAYSDSGFSNELCNTSISLSTGDMDQRGQRYFSIFNNLNNGSASKVELSEWGEYAYTYSHS